VFRPIYLLKVKIWAKMAGLKQKDNYLRETW